MNNEADYFEQFAGDVEIEIVPGLAEAMRQQFARWDQIALDALGKLYTEDQERFEAEKKAVQDHLDRLNKRA